MRGAVTGVFSYSGRFIAEALLARGWEVVAFGRRRPAPADRLAERVDFSPLLLDDEEALVTALSGCEALFNTYWVRFEHGGATFAEAIERSSHLFHAASGAEVRRIVHLSVSNARADSPFAYFRGKAAVEDVLRRTDCRYAILRPTLIFGGREEVLVNNIAWLLRRLPLFLLPDGGRCRLQPVSVFDLARIAADLGETDGNLLRDCAGGRAIASGCGRGDGRDRLGARGAARPAASTLRLLRCRRPRQGDDARPRLARRRARDPHAERSAVRARVSRRQADPHGRLQEARARHGPRRARLPLPTLLLRRPLSP